MSASSPTGGIPAPDLARHYFKRAYQACINCRRRKVKCIMECNGQGLLQASCTRCRRELRHCTFSAERNSQTSHQDAGDMQRTVNVIEDMSAHPGEAMRQRPRHQPRHTSPEDMIHAQAHEEITVSGGSRKRQRQRQSPRRITARRVFNAVEIQSPVQEREYQHPTTGFSTQQSGLSPIGAAHEQNLRPELRIRPNNDSFGAPNPTERVSINGQLISRNSSSTGHVATSEPWLSFRHPLSPSSPDTVRHWGSWHFVRTGLITAEEAVTYIDLFFRNMNKLSPILHSFYRDHTQHGDLISREPLLCCAIIALSARYHILDVDGAVTRGFYIHDRLWEHCQTLFQRLVWNQRRAIKDQMVHLGTIETFLLAAEWHPRCVHFPIETEYWQPEMALSDDEQTTSCSKVPNKWLREVEEAAHRSDRMSWMLLGNALSLSHELDIFSDQDNLSVDVLDSASELSFANFLRLRRHRVGKLLFVYISQLASRIGCSLPRTPFHDSVLSSLQNPESKLDNEWHEYMTSWIELSRLIRTSSDFLFPSKKVTQELVRSGRYTAFLGHFRPLLSQWWDKFKRHASNATCWQLILVDYHFVRVYINSLALQAVSDRMCKDDGQMSSSQIKDSQDSDFVREVIDASSRVLQMVIELSRDGNLKYLPVRIFIRVASASMYLINALALGVRGNELDRLLSLLDRTVEALCLNAVDDVHLGFRYAVLLKENTKGLRERFIRVNPLPMETPFFFNDADAFLGNPTAVLAPPHDTEAAQPNVPPDVEDLEADTGSNFVMSTPESGQELVNENSVPGHFPAAGDYSRDEWFALPFTSEAELGKPFMSYFFGIEPGDERYFWDVA
ncbi:hypothetical protein GGI35DRAFT_434229 [Trichoderma velutinum]